MAKWSKYGNNRQSRHRRYKSTEAKAEQLRRLTKKYYEEGNQSKCYKAVWRNYVYPLYKIDYRTYLRLLDIPLPPEDDYPLFPGWVLD